MDSFRLQKASRSYFFFYTAPSIREWLVNNDFAIDSFLTSNNSDFNEFSITDRADNASCVENYSLLYLEDDCQLTSSARSERRTWPQFRTPFVSQFSPYQSITCFDLFPKHLFQVLQLFSRTVLLLGKHVDVTEFVNCCLPPGD